MQTKMSAIFLALAVVSVVIHPAFAAQTDSSVDQSHGVLNAPPGELDSRISATKITENDPAQLPERIVLPIPAVHRISNQADQVPIDAETWAKANEAIRRGLTCLESQADARGGWSRGAAVTPTDQPDKPAPVALAITSLVVKAFLQGDPNAMDRECVSRALRLIRAAQNPDGSFDNGPIANYVTSSVLQALAAVGDDDDQPLRTEAVTWLQSNQWDQSEGLGPRQDWFGGSGYGNHGRPDLSNTQMMLDALYDAGLSPSEPAFQRALIFASRTQNLKATNPSPWVDEREKPGGDGGFVYTPANGGESFGSDAAGEGRYGEKLVAAGEPRSLRSYGSMTYAGFKSMVYAGLSQNDVRVQTALDWFRRHWTFDENPGLGQQGLYYYYHTLSRALYVSQLHEIADDKGVKHNWRSELIAALLKRQRDDGSWVNEADRWMEGDPVLVTTYAVLALEEAIKPVIANQ